MFGISILILPIPLVRLIPFVIIVEPFSANNLTTSWWPSIEASSIHVRVWSFRACNKWCCWIASKRIFSIFFVGTVKISVKFERFPRREQSNNVSVNWGIFICSINAARSWALFYFKIEILLFFWNKSIKLLFSFLLEAKNIKNKIECQQ